MTTFADTTFTDPELIRNFCIIAHIDHGKSTLADRMLQLTGVVDARGDARAVPRPDGHRARARHHDQGQAVRLPWTVARRRQRQARPQHDRHARARRLHLRGVPRRWPPARARCCWSTPRRASRRRRWPTSTWRWRTTCTIIPVLNKIDLPAAQPEQVRRGARAPHRLRARRTCCGSPARPARASRDLLDEIVRQVPPPVGDADAPARAMIFDSVYDIYRGVVTYVRVIDGQITPARADQDDVHRRDARAARGRRHLAGAASRPRASASARSAT